MTIYIIKIKEKGIHEVYNITETNHKENKQKEKGNIIAVVKIQKYSYQEIGEVHVEMTNGISIKELL